MCLNTLCRIDEQQRPLAGGNTPTYFVAEIDVSRSVNQIEGIRLPVGVLVLHLDSVALDRDAPLALQVHIVQGLLLNIAVTDRTGELQQPVGQGRFPVVDVGNDAKIADVFHIVSWLRLFHL